MRTILFVVACSAAFASTGSIHAAVTTTEPAPGAKTLENGFDLDILSGKKPVITFYDQEEGGLFFTRSSGNSTSSDVIAWDSKWLVDGSLAGNDPFPHLFISQTSQGPTYAGISYYNGNQSNIHFIEGQSPDNGTSWSWDVPTEVSSGSVVQGSNDLTMVKSAKAQDTTLVVSYFDESGTIAVAEGIQPSQGNSTMWNQPQLLSSTYGAGQYLSATSINSFMDAVVGVAYYDENYANLKYIAGNMGLNGTSSTGNGSTLYNSINWADPVMIDGNATVGQYCDITNTSAGGYPVVAYYDAGNTSLKFAAAENINGSSWLESEIVVDTAAEIANISLTTTGLGQVGITYYDSGLKNLMYVSGTPSGPWSANGTSWGNETLWSKPVRVTAEHHNTSAVLGSRINAKGQTIPAVVHMDNSNSLFYSESTDGIFSSINSSSGDVNGDGLIDLRDAVLPLQIVTGAQPDSVTDLSGDLVSKVHITIDGSMNDWAGVPYLIADPVGDNSGTASGSDIKYVYLARNDEYLFVAFKLGDGLPAGTNYYQTNLQNWSSYALFDVSIRYDSATEQWVTDFRADQDYNGSLETTLHTDLAAVSDGFVEGRVSLSAIPFSVSDSVEFTSKIYSQGNADTTTTVYKDAGISSLPYIVGNGTIGIEESLNALKTSAQE